MFSRDKNLHALERFIYKHLGAREASAYLFANIVGVHINIKTAAQCEWPAAQADAKTMWLLTKKLKAIGLFALFDAKENDNQVFYVAKSRKRAESLRSAFQKLHNQGATAETNTIIGTLLGYPASAVQYYIRLHPENGISDNHKEMMARNRFYAHSLAHENEEFLAYEAPIYKYLSRHCPRTAKILTSDTAKRWLD